MSVAPIGPIAAALRVQILGAAWVVAVIIGFIMRAAGTLPPEQALTPRPFVAEVGSGSERRMVYL